MNRGNKRISKQILFLLLLMFVLFIPVLNNTHTVDACSSSSVGCGHTNPPTDPGAGWWFTATGPTWTGSGTTPAWDYFVSLQMYKYHISGEPGLIKHINEAGRGFRNEDGSYENLADSCKRSEHIFWYGSANQWNGSDGARYKQGSWFTNGANTHINKHWVQPIPSEAGDFLDDFTSNPQFGWTSGRINIICSGVSQREVPIKNVTFVANSGTFDYNGSYRTVQGLNTSQSYLSEIWPHHYYDISATRSEVNPGMYPVNFSRANIRENGTNKLVNDQYNISTRPGLLTIRDEPFQPSNTWRCIDTQSDSASAYVFNTTTGSHGFTPSLGSFLRGLYNDRTTPAGHYAYNNMLPSRGSPLSSWTSWKNAFQNGSDTITPELNLESGGSTSVSSILSKYGGVYNITKSLQRDTYNVTHCQPQTRYLHVVCNPVGEDVSCETVWSSWANSGGRIIWTSSGPSSTEEKSNYQILSVNCNKSGFDRVRSQVNGQNLSLAGGHGGAVLKTPSRPGAATGTLGRGGHETATNAFYNDGTSCKEAFRCTDTRGSAANDSNNNRRATPRFTEYDTVLNEHGLARDNSLIFFRDNEDRQVRADIWYPRATGLSDLNSYSGSPAKRTLARIYTGTPELELTTIAPWDNEGLKLNAMNSERSWGGQVNRLLMKSQWASKEGKPYELGLNWEYQATGHNHVPARVNGDNVLGMTGQKTYYFDAYCEFKNGSGDYQSNIPQTPFAVGTTSRIWTPSQAVRVLFSRSVSDTER